MLCQCLNQTAKADMAQRFNTSPATKLIFVVVTGKYYPVFVVVVVVQILNSPVSP